VGGIAQLPVREGIGALSQNLLDALKRGRLDPIRGLSRVVFDNGESEGRRLGAERELEPVVAGCGAMLDCEVEVLTLSTQLEV
jgi:hypothetical protein